jgi:2-oxoglutarate ferredoxin oxidoreductase subunit alpha
MPQSAPQHAKTNSAQQAHFNWKIAGAAGHGVMLAAKLMAKMSKRHGWQAFNYLEYPSLIRGGHQTGQVYAAPKQATCQRRQLDVLIVYTQESFKIHAEEIQPETTIIYNQDFGQLEPQWQQQWGQQITSMPLSTWAEDSAGHSLAANIVALGVSAAVLGLKPEICQQVIADEFAKQQLVDGNQQAFLKGYHQAESTSAQSGTPLSNVTSDSASPAPLLMTGNEAIGLGALAAGLQFYSAYPMTPATGLLHFLNEHKQHFPLVVKQVEDEIGAINEALGASVAGVRAMTGTSGGGFALMVESLAFAGVAEIPLVILEAQRTGPASGVPTWTGQADLQFVLTAGHGDFPRVVLTPGTVEEHFQLTQVAVYLAEKYQLPVIILSDKYILESHQVMPHPSQQRLTTTSVAADSSELRKLLAQRHSLADQVLAKIRLERGQDYDDGGSGPETAAETGSAPANQDNQKNQENQDRNQAGFDPTYYRYQLTAGDSAQAVSTQGISPRALPGQEYGWHLANSYEHDEWGFATEQSSMIEAQVEKRAQKMEAIHKELPQPQLMGPPEAQVTFVSWGSTTNVLLEVIHQVTPGLANFIHLPCLQPFPSQSFKELAQSAQKLVMVEGNANGQGENWIKQQTGVTMDDQLRRYDGRPFYPEDLLDYLQRQA